MITHICATVASAIGTARLNMRLKPSGLMARGFRYQMARRSSPSDSAGSAARSTFGEKTVAIMPPPDRASS